MHVRKNLLTATRKYLYGVFLLMFVSLICVAFSMVGGDDYDIARREIVLRRIGHEILLQSGDSSSRVLPVKKIAKHEYQLSFEHAFTFQPDILVTTTQRLLANDPLTHDYIVNVVNCNDNSVAYGFAISKNKKDEVVACKGRPLPIACYKINLTFKPTTIVTAKNGYFLGGLSFLGLVGLIFLRAAKPQKILHEISDLPDSRQVGTFTLGTMSFDPESRKLMKDRKAIDLTRTESRVLRIFALAPNEIIERSQLQEIWEDEGVLVGRSLDVFISKLRKKLEFDPNIKIVVIRGRGYKLEIRSKEELPAPN